ncbi:transcriptional regulator [Thioclava sp. L04-15]|uniref:sugar-binding transcriptional regulator n=1 Tax=Thioclava sp. L04-15 TaxID=1915318 RepID=UPI000997E1FC|nr:sugar-binding domain-containing protein [Thioclava sp. L04-15]OOY27916.1 transcriptional regulator [Thioclava sp. L04-15]TNE93227.1 MAG: HTH domain-containing protein [Paracoccaceae bacterium]
MAGTKRRTTGQISGENVVIEVAWMYYQESLNQKEIADRLGISRATVVNYLQEAREQGLVRISLRAEAFTRHRAAVELCERFGLSTAYVVPDEGADMETTFHRVVQGAADWLPDLLEPGDRLGLAWGRTIYDLAAATERTRIEDLSVLQLVGSMSTPYGFTAEACSTRLAQRLGARCFNLHAPAVLSSGELAAALRAEPIIHDQLARLETCNKFLFSVGTCLPDSHVVGSGVATQADLGWYIAHGAKGVLCGRFIDGEGKGIDGPLEPRMIGIPLEKLVGLDMGILVTPGLDKVVASRAAIRGGYVSHLVTSLGVAEALLSED